MTTAKNEVFIGLQLENCYLVEGELTFGGGQGLLGGDFLGGGGMSKFSAVGGGGGGLSPFFPVEKTLKDVFMSHFYDQSKVI